jgi:hypothetical protein
MTSRQRRETQQSFTVRKPSPGYLGQMIKTSADYSLADTPCKKASSTVATLLVGGLFALAALWLWVSRTLLPGELISPVSPKLFAATVFVGVFCSLLLAARIMTVRARSNVNRPGRRLDVVGGALILPVLASTACLRMVVQAGAFVGVTPQITPAQFTVDGFRKNHSTHLLRVRLGEGGREFSVPVRTALYDAAQLGDTITLPVETGRYGVQRAMIAGDLTDADLHHHF